MSEKKSDLSTYLADIITGVERTLTNKTVLGNPMTVGDYTIIPLVTVGLGFGGGGGGPQKQDFGSGYGGGGGGGMTPIAVVIVGPNGAQVIELGADKTPLGESAKKLIESLTTQPQK